MSRNTPRMKCERTHLIFVVMKYDGKDWIVYDTCHSLQRAKRGINAPSSELFFYEIHEAEIMPSLFGHPMFKVKHIYKYEYRWYISGESF